MNLKNYGRNKMLLKEYFMKLNGTQKGHISDLHPAKAFMPVEGKSKELISISKDLQTYKGKKVPKGKYEVRSARGKFASLERIHDMVDGGTIYDLVPISDINKVAKKLKWGKDGFDEARTINVEPNWEGVWRFFKHIEKTSPGQWNKMKGEFRDSWKQLQRMADKEGWVSESVNEASGDLNDVGYKKIKAGFKYLDSVVKKLQAAVKKEDSKETIKSIKGLNDIAGIMYDMIGVGRFYESINEALPSPPLKLSKSQLKGMIRRAKRAGAKGYDIILSLSRDLSLTSDEMVSTLEKHRLIGMTEGLINDLRLALVKWESKEYPNDKVRWNDYHRDIRQLVNKHGQKEHVSEVASPLMDTLKHAKLDVDELISVSSGDEATHAYNNPKRSRKLLMAIRKLLSKVN
jgi:hypothetical protein